MNRSSRVSLFRRLAFALVTAQALAFALVPAFEGRTAPGTGMRLERSHADCAIVHRPDTCVACQLMTVRLRAPLASETSLPLGGRVLAVVPPRTTHHAPRTEFAAGLHSRAPPRSA